MPFFENDHLQFYYRDEGSGIPFFFQHGLGGDTGQPFGVFSPPDGIRMLCFDCRGHGRTQPLGDPAKLGMASYSNDLLSLMTHLGIEQAIVGGISMGAAVALNFTLRSPEQVMGLVISRPAWLDGPMGKSADIYAMIAQLIRRWGPARGLELFKQSEIYTEVLKLSPDAAKSLCGQFENPRAEGSVAILERLPRDAPNADRRQWASITVPTLILATRQDPIHPFEYGEQIAQIIPNAEFHEITPKSISKEQHVLDAQATIESFLGDHFTNKLHRE
jgi:pimeloyl-ACP methyl ester carboxylesterase